MTYYTKMSLSYEERETEKVNNPGFPYDWFN